MNEKKSAIVLVASILVILTAIAGCIEGSFLKTETVLMKLDSYENIQWTTVIDNNDYASAQSLAPAIPHFIQTSDNGFLIADLFYNRTGDRGIRIIKTDSRGNPAWEKRIPGQAGEILTLLQRNDGGYAVVWRDGRLFAFDAAGNLGMIVNIPELVKQTQGTELSTVTLRSIIQTSDGNMSAVLTGGDYYNIQQPVITAGISRNGTIVWENVSSLEISAGTIALMQTQDSGCLLEKTVYDYKPGGGKKILLEKTDSNRSVAWDSQFGICNYTFCNNDLLGMHESKKQEIEIIYLSHEQSNATSGNPSITVYLRLDRNGRVQQQALVTNVSGLPAWIFEQWGSSSELNSLVPENIIGSMRQEKSNGNPSLGGLSLLKTDGEGYALLGIRYYRG